MKNQFPSKLELYFLAEYTFHIPTMRLMTPESKSSSTSLIRLRRKARAAAGFLLLAGTLFCCAASFGGETGTYCNSRFRYCVDYPQSFIPQGESDNGDGQVFLSGTDPKTEMRVFGSNNVLEESLQDVLLRIQNDLKTKAGKVTYQTRKKNWLVVSGIRNGGAELYYTKVIQNRDQFLTLTFTYPQAEQKRLDALIAQLVKSFKIKHP
jgi:hypothetical protein